MSSAEITTLSSMNFTLSDLYENNTDSFAKFESTTLLKNSSANYENSTVIYDYNTTYEYEYEYYGDYYYFEIYPFETVSLGMVRPALVLLTTITNLFVMGFFMSRNNRGKATNLLFVSIAFSDTMTGLSLVPNSIYVYGYVNEELSKEWCNIYMLTRFYISRVFHTVSVWQTVVLCLQRYMCVCHPFISGRVWTFWKTFASIVVMYCLAIVMHLYHLTNNKLGHYRCRWYVETPCTETCVYLWFCVALQHFLPCLLLVALTIITIKELKKANKRVSSMSLRSGTKRSSRDRVITITATLIVVVFLIPELPHGIYRFAFVISKHIGNKELFIKETNHFFICLYELLLVTSFNANFWIYCAMMSDFRRAIVTLLTGGLCKKGISRIRKLSGSLSSRNGSIKTYVSRTGSFASRNRILSQTTSVHSIVSDGAHAIVPLTAEEKLGMQRMISNASGDYNHNSEEQSKRYEDQSTLPCYSHITITDNVLDEKSRVTECSEHIPNLEQNGGTVEEDTDVVNDDDVFL